ncbi:MAG: ABC transporter ATP-binding protein/permease [Anaerolineales bacterium]|nr:ABC transporter ATP-binding protein/permease [Anaerolineales bacterium]
MNSWYAAFKRGLGRKLPDDRLADESAGRLKPGGWRDLDNLRPFVRRHSRQGVVGAGLILLTTLLAFPYPLLYRYLIDQVILGRQLRLLVGIVLLLAGLKLAEMLASQLQRFYFTRFEQDVMLDLQSALLERTLRLPKAFFDERQTGYLMSRLTSDVEGLRWFFSGTLVYVASSAIQLVGGAVFLFYLEWRLALAAVVVLPVLMGVVRFFARHIYVLSRQEMEQRANVSKRLQESLATAPLIKSFNTEGREVAHFQRDLRSAFQVSLEWISVGAAANLIIGLVGDAARMLVLLTGAYLIIQDNWTLGSLLAFQSYLGYVYSPAQYLAYANLDMNKALAALGRVADLFDIAPEEAPGVGLQVAHLRGQVELDEVSFAYSAGAPVLEQISFTVQPGERIAIVGPSGAGKTTLISLLLCFYKPTSGEIRFDGTPLGAYNLSSLRQRIGYVSQHTLLSSGTIQDNLRYGNQQADPQELERAARIAGIHEFILSLPEGYQAPVTALGDNFSEGQKQRLAIARALVKDPDILVLDEPTAALDSLVERSILDQLPGALAGKTIFIVAHRLSTVQNADRILLLNEKRLAAIGTHAELLQTSAYYRTLAEEQQIWTE